MTGSVDHAEIKTTQVLAIATASLAFLFEDPALLAALGAVFAVTALARPLSPFVLFYRYVVRPLDLVRSDYRLDNIQAHSFGQLIGAATVAAAVACLYAGYDAVGWGIVWVLIGLTGVSYAGWCVGCFLYYQIRRLGIGGFFRHAPTDPGRVTGTRPRARRGDDGAE